MEDEDTFLVEGEFAFRSYMPDELKPGMHFLSQVTIGTIEPEWLFFTLEHTPDDEEMFMSLYGAPVKLMIIDSEGNPLVNSKEIGWFHNEDAEVLHSITDAEITHILNKNDGFMDIETDEHGDPIYLEDKVIISYLSDEGEEEES